MPLLKLKKIGVLSAAKLEAAIMVVIGLIIGTFFAVLGTVLGALGGPAGLGSTLGFGAIIVFPILYGIIGFVGGAIGAFIYNVFAQWVGGIELELER